MRFFFGFSALLGLIAMAAVSCSGGDETGSSVCEPGALTFCKCRGADRPGKKLCKDDGNSFEACVADDGGECLEIPVESTSGDTSFSSTTGEGSGGTGGTSTVAGTGGSSTSGQHGSKTLYEACADETECAEGLECLMGFCTAECFNQDQCDANNGDCVAVGDTHPMCLPYCSTADDCTYGENSTCSWSLTTDPNYAYNFCADWEEVVLAPDGFECSGDDSVCNMNYQSSERICGPDGCTTGCRVNEDCPDGFECFDDQCF